MNYNMLIITILLAGLIFSAGCTSIQQGQTSSSQIIQPTTTSSEQIPVIGGAEKSEISDSVSLTSPLAQPSVSSQSVSPTTSTIEKSSDMPGFISTSFPKITEIYSEIKKSRNALDWKKVQEQALSLQIQIQNLKKTYMLDVPNPEKTVFVNLNSKEQIVFLKYLRYLNDMENYGVNLKNAVYYQEKGGDADSLLTARRYQNIADQFEKQAIAEVKTISDYGTDFKYTFINPVTVQEYRYI
jgi:hypothetical protein